MSSQFFSMFHGQNGKCQKIDTPYCIWFWRFQQYINRLIPHIPNTRIKYGNPTVLDGFFHLIYFPRSTPRPQLPTFEPFNKLRLDGTEETELHDIRSVHDDLQPTTSHLAATHGHGGGWSTFRNVLITDGRENAGPGGRGHQGWSIECTYCVRKKNSFNSRHLSFSRCSVIIIIKTYIKNKTSNRRDEQYRKACRTVPNGKVLDHSSPGTYRSSVGLLSSSSISGVTWWCPKCHVCGFMLPCLNIYIHTYTFHHLQT